MNPAFNYNFGDIGGNKADHNSEQNNISTGTPNNYVQPGHNRNICFHWLDGRSLFLNYSYLVSCELSTDQSTIQLEFTTHTLLLSGLFLRKLFEDIMHQLAMHIYCADARYNALEESSSAVINTITIDVKN